MQRVRLHADGPELSRIVWGAWRILKVPGLDAPEPLADFIAGALDCGVTSFDHADIYGAFQAEALFGQALKRWGGPRRSIEIITKCGISPVVATRPEHRVMHYNTGAAHIRASVDRSLANLGTDYIDLLLIHRPDPFMNADETARGLEEVVKAGKVRSIGVSNHLPSQVDLLQSRLSLPLVTNQVQVSAAHVDPFFDGTFDQAQRLRARPMAWSPLGGGSLFTGSDERSVRLRAAFGAIASRTGNADIGALALAWLMAHPAGIVPVVGTGKLDRLQTAVAAADVGFDRQDWFAVLEASRGYRVP